MFINANNKMKFTFSLIVTWSPCAGSISFNPSNEKIIIFYCLNYNLHFKSWFRKIEAGPSKSWRSQNYRFRNSKDWQKVKKMNWFLLEMTQQASIIPFSSKSDEMELSSKSARSNSFSATLQTPQLVLLLLLCGVALITHEGTFEWSEEFFT